MPLLPPLGPRSTFRTFALLALAAFSAAAWSGELATIPVRTSASAAATQYDGTVEAVRQAEIAAQVPGRVIDVGIHPGDRVRAGQILLRIDGEAAAQTASASSAQVAAARAALDNAVSELNRKRQLAAKGYLSQSALDQAVSQERSARSNVAALAAQAAAAHTQAGFYVLRAPFDGIVSAVPAKRGDTAMPGQPLATMYDPSALRVTAHVPSSAQPGDGAGALVWLASSDQPIKPASVQFLPTVDPRSLTLEVRANLAAGVRAVPGEFARLELPGASARAGGRLFIPESAVVRRAEVTAVYVLGAQGQPQLRQIRLGPRSGNDVEVLTGLDPSDRVVAQPELATRDAAQAADHR